MNGLKIHKFGTIQKEVATSFFQDEKIAGSFIQNFGFYLAFIIFSKFNKNDFFSIILKSFLISLVSISIFISFQRMPMIIWIFFLTIYGIIYYLISSIFGNLCFYKKILILIYLKKICI